MGSGRLGGSNATQRLVRTEGKGKGQIKSEERRSPACAIRKHKPTPRPAAGGRACSLCSSSGCKRTGGALSWSHWASLPWSQHCVLWSNWAARSLQRLGHWQVFLLHTEQSKHLWHRDWTPFSPDQFPKTFASRLKHPPPKGTSQSTAFISRHKPQSGAQAPQPPFSPDRQKCSFSPSVPASSPCEDPRSPGLGSAGMWGMKALHSRTALVLPLSQMRGDGQNTDHTAETRQKWH